MRYDIEIRTIHGEKKTLEEYRGDVLLIVNTATRCGFAPQFRELQQLHETYAGMGLRVLGFPCNQFAAQEPGDEQAIESECRLDHGVTFPLHAKIDVRGRNAHPLYLQLTREARGFLWTKAIKWNFTKFLVDRQGQVVKRYAPNVTPDKIKPQIVRLLGQHK